VDEPVHGNDSDFRARMKSLSKGNEGLSYRDFQNSLREMGDCSVQQLKEVVSFAYDQLGFWDAEWMFSSAHMPNEIAAAESEGWRQLCRICTDKLVKNVPEVRGQLEKQESYASLKHTIKRRVDYNKTRPFSRLAESVISPISFGLDKLGFKGIALQLYARSMYPRGTVGHQTVGRLKG
jgi:hypothetical protein